VEVKRWGVSVHLRGATSVDVRDVERVVRSVAGRHGLDVAPGRLVYELRPAGIPDKGRAVRRLVAAVQPTAAVYAGDDVGDGPAFAAIQEMSDRIKTLTIGMASAEAPEEVMAACDLVLSDRAELVRVFEALLQLA
jgi:trehalose 6-phosphate phosphatase